MLSSLVHKEENIFQGCAMSDSPFPVAFLDKVEDCLVARSCLAGRKEGNMQVF